MTEAQAVANSLLADCFHGPSSEDYEGQLERINAAVSVKDEPAPSPSLAMERRIDALVRDLDELVALAADPSTVQFVEEQKSSIGQIICRAQLVGSVLMARKPTTVRR